MKKYLIFFTVGLISLTVLLAHGIKINKKFPFYKKCIFSFLQITKIIVLGFFFAYALLFFIAFIHLNLFSLSLQINPNIVGIETNTDQITKVIKTSNNPPKIITADNNQYQTLLAMTKTTTNQSSFYVKSILSSFPSFLVFPANNAMASILLINNTIIVTEIKPNTIQQISPALAYLLIKQFFSNRAIKSYPRITVLDQQQYAAFRTDDANLKLEKITLLIEKTDKNIGSLSATITAMEEAAVSDKNAVEKTSQEGNQQYKKCLSERGKTNTEATRITTATCKNILSQYAETVNTKQKNILSSNGNLQSLKRTLAINKAYSSFYKTLLEKFKNTKENIPDELGFFTPDDSIRILLKSFNSRATTDYLATLTHEYLHYASYISQENKLDSFFEEALTEYFSRRIIQNSLTTDTNLGYPVQVKIISEIANVIPEDELTEIYFTKDQEALKESLDRLYGQGFYETNQLIFESIQYASSQQEILKLANDIMKKIAGTPLTEKDLVSSFGNY